MNAEHINVLHTSKAALAQSGSSGLREGSLVSGRVIGKTGSQSYIVSIAGRQVEVRSSQNLAQGSAFTAKISVRGNQIVLVLQHSPAENAKSPVTKYTSSSLTSLNSNALAQTIASIGLPVSAQTVRLVQFMQELGVKINPESIKKAIARSEKFSGREEEAAETSILLSEKGLENGDDSVLAVFEGEGGSSSGSSSNRGANYSGGARHDCGENKTKDGGCSCPEEKASVAERRVAAGTEDEKVDGSLIKDYVSSADKAALLNKNGALSVFNMMSPCWAVFPFESENSTYTGVIRVLIKQPEKFPKKMIVECQSRMAKYFFMLYFKVSSIEKVLFRTIPSLPSEKQSYLSGILKQMIQSCGGQDVPVTYTDSELFPGFSAADSPVFSVEGEA